MSSTHLLTSASLLRCLLSFSRNRCGRARCPFALLRRGVGWGAAGWLRANYSGERCAVPGVSGPPRFFGVAEWISTTPRFTENQLDACAWRYLPPFFFFEYAAGFSRERAPLVTLSWFSLRPASLRRNAGWMPQNVHSALLSGAAISLARHHFLGTPRGLVASRGAVDSGTRLGLPALGETPFFCLTDFHFSPPSVFFLFSKSGLVRRRNHTPY